jgi:hypothetical protein
MATLVGVSLTSRTVSLQSHTGLDFAVWLVRCQEVPWEQRGRVIADSPKDAVTAPFKFSCSPMYACDSSSPESYPYEDLISSV